MPLIKKPGKKALQENIETEMDAHPSKDKRDQNLAIAYSVQRQAKKKKMAMGGKVESDSPGQPVKMSSEHGMREEHEHSANPPKTHSKMTHEGPQQHKMKVPTDPSMRPSSSSHMLEDDSIPHSMAEAIMLKRKDKMMSESGMMPHEDSMKSREDDIMGDMAPDGIDMGVSDHDSVPSRKKYAMGGEVDLHSNEEEQPNSYYHQNEEEALDIDFDGTMDGLSQPEDSNEHNPGDELLEESDEHDMIGKIMKKRKK